MNSDAAPAFLLFVLGTISIAPILFYAFIKTHSEIDGNYIVTYRFFKKITKRYPIRNIKRLSIYNYNNRGFGLVVRATLKNNEHFDLYSIDYLSSRTGAAKYFERNLYIVSELLKINPYIDVALGLQKRMKRREKVG